MEILTSSLLGNQNQNPSTITHGTVYLGYMYAYYECENELNLTGMLDFLILQSLRNTDNIMVILLDEVIDTYKCPIRALLSCTVGPTTEPS